MTDKIYRSPYEAYPFLSDGPDDLRCDFELMTDGMASVVGLLRSKVTDGDLREELLWICELVYHMNPALRTGLKVTAAEKERSDKIAAIGKPPVLLIFSASEARSLYA